MPLLGRYHLIQSPGHLSGVVLSFNTHTECPQNPFQLLPGLPSSLGPQPNFRLHHFFLKYGCIFQHRCCWPVGFLLSLLNPFRGTLFSLNIKISPLPRFSVKAGIFVCFITVFPEPITLHSRSSVNACWLNMHVSTLYNEQQHKVHPPWYGLGGPQCFKPSSSSLSPRVFAQHPPALFLSSSFSLFPSSHPPGYAFVTPKAEVREPGKASQLPLLLCAFQLCSQNTHGNLTGLGTLCCHCWLTPLDDLYFYLLYLVFIHPLI